MRARWLLDTCVLSEPTQRQPNAAVMDWLHRHVGDSMVSAASFGEIHYGIACLPHSAKRNQLNTWATALAKQFPGRVLSTDDLVWRQFGELKSSLRAIGRMQDALDLVIAATALAHGLVLVTRNTRHFQDTGLPLVDPWAASATPAP